MKPRRKYTGDRNAGAFDVHPDFRTRKQHLDVIGALKRKDPGEATTYWLTHCPRISKKTYLNA